MTEEDEMFWRQLEQIFRRKEVLRRNLKVERGLESNLVDSALGEREQGLMA